MEERDIPGEYKVGFLKHLDSLFCNENKSTCVWIDNTLIIVDSNNPISDRRTNSVIELQLNVSFCLNIKGDIVATYIK